MASDNQLVNKLYNDSIILREFLDNETKDEIKKIYDQFQKDLKIQNNEIFNDLRTKVNTALEKFDKYRISHSTTYESIYNKFQSLYNSNDPNLSNDEKVKVLNHLFNAAKYQISTKYEINEGTLSRWNQLREHIDQVPSEHKHIFIGKDTFKHRYDNIQENIKNRSLPNPKSIYDASSLVNVIKTIPVTVHLRESLGDKISEIQNILREIKNKNESIKNRLKYFGISTPEELQKRDQDIKKFEEKVAECQKHGTGNCASELRGILHELELHTRAELKIYEEFIPKGAESSDEIRKKLLAITSHGQLKDKTRERLMDLWRKQLVDRSLTTAGFGDYKTLIKKAQDVLKTGKVKPEDEELLKKMTDYKFTSQNTLRDDDKIKPELASDLKLLREKLKSYKVKGEYNILTVILLFIVATIVTTLTYVLIAVITIIGLILLTWLTASTITIIIQGIRGKLEWNQIPLRYIMGWIYPIMVLAGKMD